MVDVRSKVQYLPPAMLENGTRDISLNLKGRIVQSILEKNNSGNSMRRNLLRWWVRCHKEYIALSIKKIPITAKITHEIAIYRLKYLVDVARYERRKLYNEERIRQFVMRMEKVCGPVPMRHKAYTFRRLLSKDPRVDFFNRLIMSQKCKQTEALRSLRNYNRYFNGSIDRRNEFILIEQSMSILEKKATQNVQKVLLDSVRVRR
jgi:hypothetical protein